MVRSLSPRLDTPLPEQVAGDALDATYVHVLFVDIVGFSKLTIEGQSRASAQLLCAAESTHSHAEGTRAGNLVCVDTGDGLALAFEGNPLGPARAALELASALAGCDLKLRLGVHSGPVVRCIDIAGKPNLRGVGMNVAQRVMDSAVPDQIVLSEHYASTIRHFDGWASRIVPIGVHTAKHGLKLRLCELTHENAPKRSGLATTLRRELPPVPIVFKWLGLVVLFVAFGAATFVALSARTPSSHLADDGGGPILPSGYATRAPIER